MRSFTSQPAKGPNPTVLMAIRWGFVATYATAHELKKFAVALI
jgi:hypothetical protein